VELLEGVLAVPLKEKLGQLLSSQKALVQEYEAIVQEFAASDVISENIALKREVDELRKTAGELRVKHARAEKESRELRLALHEQMLGEKTGIITASQDKVKTYFGRLTGKQAKDLRAIEQSANEKLSVLRKLAEKELGESKTEITAAVAKLTAEVEGAIRTRQEELAAQQAGILEELKQDYDGLAGEDVSEEVMRERVRQNSVELKLGLNWANRIGVFLILAGVVTAMQYTYSVWFNDYMRGVFAFLIGGIFLAGGEWFNRKEKNVFSFGLTGGGVAVLYFASFSSYFFLKIIDLRTGMVLALLTTLATVVLSLRYRSRTICAFALLGGYLPFITYTLHIGLSPVSINISMGYLLLLNLLILLISFSRQWPLINYLSFGLNVPALVFLVYLHPIIPLSIGYTLLTFTMYLAIALAYPLRYGVSLRVPDTALLAFNTVLSSGIVYTLFTKGGYEAYLGFFALAFAAVYFTLGQLADRRLAREKQTRGIFYLTSLAFTILIIPLQFGIEWLTLGWLAEAALLINFGRRQVNERLEYAGWLILVLSLGAFYAVDFASQVTAWAPVSFFDFKYTAVMAGLAYLLYIYLPDLRAGRYPRHTLAGKWLTGFKYFTIVNIWTYVVLVVDNQYGKYVHIPYYGDYYRVILLALITLAVAYGLKKLTALRDTVVDWFVIGLHGLVDVVCLWLNLTARLQVTGRDAGYAALAVLLAYNVYVFFNLRNLFTLYLRRAQLSREYLPLGVTVYLLSVATVLLVFQFRLRPANLVFSIMYLAAAFTSVFVGFRARYARLRRFGLALSVLALAKLFIYDLSYLAIGGKIVAYFAFGLLLLGISLVYQRLMNNFEASDTE